MKIEYENILKQAFKTGVNLFVGAGFSVLAEDKLGRPLPLANRLLVELKEKFNKKNNLNLPQLSTLLEASAKKDFYAYLIERFTVSKYDPLYDSLLNINVKSIYTTNIDNLIPCIVNNNKRKYINDQAENGPAIDAEGINYLPLHGSVISTSPKFVFDIVSLSNVYNNFSRLWGMLSKELETRPTIFLGYSFNDSSVIQSLTSQQTFRNAQKDIWVLVREEDKDSIEFYEALGFHVIIGDTKEFLSYLNNFKQEECDISLDKERIELLYSYFVPRSLSELKVQRPIVDFWSGSSPIWSDILSNQIYRTHYVSELMNSIYNPSKNTIIIGAPVTGKTTLLMQIAYSIKEMGIKLYFKSLTETKAEYVAKLIDNDKAIIFIDNLYDSIDSINKLNKPNIKLVCAERSHNYGIISHLIENSKFSVINVTSLSDYDLQGIYNSLPSSIRTEFLNKEDELRLYAKDSIFEFVIRNIKAQSIKERYKNAIQVIEYKDKELAEFLILCAYMHSCRVPLSFEVAYSYFDDFDYNDIFNLKEDAEDIIKDYIPVDGSGYKDMDYYYPRSTYVAEIILDAASSSIKKSVLLKFIENVHKMIIPNYKIFRKYAFDKVLISKSFESWEDGRDFYEKAFLFDDGNPYVLQQGALYLAQKGQYELAFEWIDRAISMTDNKYFSIRNSHAIILFNANINRSGSGVRAELDRSMYILEKCINADLRKRFHANTYGQQAKKYYERYKDDKAIMYLKQALLWLNQEIEVSSWDLETRKLKDSINSILSNL